VAILLNIFSQLLKYFGYSFYPYDMRYTKLMIYFGFLPLICS